MKRRKFLKNVISTTILGIGGVSGYQIYQQSLLNSPNDDGFEYQYLTADDRIVLEVLIPVFVAGLNLSQPLAIANVTQNIESTCLKISVKSQNELRELFDLLGSGLGRVMMANVWFNWQSASPESIEEFLLEWRDSRLELLQIAYKGLHKLIIGSVYTEEDIWPFIGYSGPPKISSAYPISGSKP